MVKVACICNYVLTLKSMTRDVPGTLSQLKNVLIVVGISAAMAVITTVLAYLFDSLPAVAAKDGGIRILSSLLSR